MAEFDPRAPSIARVYDYFLEMLPPGVVDARQWRAWTETTQLSRREEYTIAGVARI